MLVKLLQVVNCKNISWEELLTKDIRCQYCDPTINIGKPETYVEVGTFGNYLILTCRCKNKIKIILS